MKLGYFDQRGSAVRSMQPSRVRLTARYLYTTSAWTSGNLLVVGRHVHAAVNREQLYEQIGRLHEKHAKILQEQGRRLD